MNNMILNNYKNSGIGLSKKSLEVLETNIIEYYNNNDFTKVPMTIIEFGSGISTKFLIDLIIEYNLNIQIESFDDSDIYAHKNDKIEFLTTNIRELSNCNDLDYEVMFKEKTYNESKMFKYNMEPSFRQKNCFYTINCDDFKKEYDLLVLDGPNGNGRNFAFLHLKNKIKNNGMIFVDDVDHYDFEEKMNTVFETVIITKVLEDDRIDKWINGGRFALYKNIKI